MDKSTHEVRLSQWKDIVLQCQSRPAGMSARAWLKDNDINEKQYYYYQRLIRNEAFEEMTAASLPEAAASDETAAAIESGQLPAVQERGRVAFAEVPAAALGSVLREAPAPAASARSEYYPDAVIHTAYGTIELSNSVSEPLLRSLLEVMCHA